MQDSVSHTLSIKQAEISGITTGYGTIWDLAPSNILHSESQAFCSRCGEEHLQSILDNAWILNDTDFLPLRFINQQNLWILININIIDS